MSIRDQHSPANHHLQHVGEASWWASRDERSARCHRGGVCPTRAVPYGPVDPAARQVHPICLAAGCLDVHHDLVLRIFMKAELSEEVANPAAYLRRIAMRELVELKRVERTSSGLPAKPGRNDGVAGRINATLAAQHQDDGTWLITLFRILRCYPFSRHHVPGRWPVEGLAEERAKLLPTEASSPAIVVQEIEQVLSTARLVAGHDWVYTNLTLPLHAHCAPVEFTDFVASTDDDADATVLCTQLRDAYQHYRTVGAEREEAFERASREVTGLPSPAMTADLIAALDELEPCLRSAA